MKDIRNFCRCCNIKAIYINDNFQYELYDIETDKRIIFYSNIEESVLYLKLQIFNNLIKFTKEFNSLPISMFITGDFEEDEDYIYWNIDNGKCSYSIFELKIYACYLENIAKPNEEPVYVFKDRVSNKIVSVSSKTLECKFFIKNLILSITSDEELKNEFSLDGNNSFLFIGDLYEMDRNVCTFIEDENFFIGDLEYIYRDILTN